jgi:hypothetical protein
LDDGLLVGDVDVVAAFLEVLVEPPDLCEILIGRAVGDAAAVDQPSDEVLELHGAGVGGLEAGVIEVLFVAAESHLPVVVCRGIQAALFALEELFDVGSHRSPSL